MADPKQDLYRIMAEKIWGALCSARQGETSLVTIERAIRNHTIVPEMVSFIVKISDCDDHDTIISRRFEFRADARILLTKAGRK